jgi:hypothetical protein
VNWLVVLGAAFLWACPAPVEDGTIATSDHRSPPSSQPATEAGRWGAVAGEIACVAQRLPSPAAQREATEAVLVRHGLDQPAWLALARDLEGEAEFQRWRDETSSDCVPLGAAMALNVTDSLAHASVVSLCMREAGYPPGEMIELLHGELARAGVTMQVYLREMARLSMERLFQALVDEASASCAVILDSLPVPTKPRPSLEIGDGVWDGVITGRGEGTFSVQVQRGQVVDATADVEDLSFILSGRIFEDRSIILAGRSDVHSLQLRGRFERTSDPSTWKLGGRWEAELQGDVKRGRWTSRRP